MSRRLHVLEVTDDERALLTRAVEALQAQEYSYVGSALLSKLSPPADASECQGDE